MAAVYYRLLLLLLVLNIRQPFLVTKVRRKAHRRSSLSPRLLTQLDDPLNYVTNLLHATRYDPLHAPAMFTSAGCGAVRLVEFHFGSVELCDVVQP